ncbi:MAG: hypothetical protein K2Q20_04210, partial [Phycisphaerales bacterium]|nr:hypothetical protein [Phycisphaerales bacterium]
RGVDKARLFLLQRCWFSGDAGRPADRRFGLACWGDRWFRFGADGWEPIDEVQLWSELACWVGGFWNRREMSDGTVKFTAIDPNTRVVSELLAQLKAEVFVASERMPVWLAPQFDAKGVPRWGATTGLGRRADRQTCPYRGPAQGYLVDAKGLIALDDLVKVHEQEITHLVRLPMTPDLFTTSVLPFELDLGELVAGILEPMEAERWERLCPTFTSWLGQVTGDDETDEAEARRRQLGQMMADSLSGRRDIEKVFVVQGPQRSGKGVLIAAIRASHGHAKVEATTITKLGTQFGLFKLIGASVALLPDAHVGGRTDSTAAVEALKSISGNDPVDVEAKYGNGITVTLNARFWMFVNDDPTDKLQDNSGAFAGRLLPWVMTQSFLGAEDPTIKRRVADEGAGIATWALAHYPQVFGERVPRIQAAERSSEVADEYTELSSLLTAFARECLEMDEVLGADGKVRRAMSFHADRWAGIGELHDVYVAWCEREGKQPLSKAKILGRLRPLVNGGLRKLQRQGPDGTRVWAAVGIALRPDAPRGKAKGVVSYGRADDGSIPFEG